LSETERQKLTTNQRWVIKIGSALLTNDGAGLDAALMKSWVSQMAELVRDDVELLFGVFWSHRSWLASTEFKTRPLIAAASGRRSHRADGVGPGVAELF